MNYTDYLRNASYKNFSFTSNKSEILFTEDKILGSTLKTIYLSLRGLQGIIAIAVNLLTIIAVCKCDRLWEKCTVRFIVNLACADLVAEWQHLYI